MATEFKVLDDIEFEHEGEKIPAQIRTINYVERKAHVWGTHRKHPFTQFSKDLTFDEMILRVPIAPQNFDNVVRYQSNLPIERVKFLHDHAQALLKNRNMNHLEEMLCGFIFELSNPA